MTNTLETQQENKELLNKIADLEKQLADKEENLKVKIWHVTGQSLDEKGEVSMYAPTGTRWYKKLNKKWVDEGKFRWAVDPNETREWAKNCKRIYFDNITIEEMLDGFIKYSNELTSEWLDYVGKWSSSNTEKYEQKREYEAKIKELNKYKEQVEDLKEKTMELLSIWYEEQEKIESIPWKDQLHDWEMQDLHELANRVEEEINKVIFEIIEKLEQGFKDRSEAINVGEKWKKWNIENLDSELNVKSKEVEDKSKKLVIINDKLNDREEEVRRLQKELEDKAKKLDLANQKIGEQGKEIEKLSKVFYYSVEKELPLLPKKQSKLQQLKTQIKTHFQKLVKITKPQKQELIAKIEVKN